MVWKIAIGTFLGIVAAYLLLVWTPQKIKESADEETERQIERIREMTPADLIKACGSPTSDNVSGRALSRDISYKDIEPSFIGDKDDAKKWIFLDARLLGVKIELNILDVNLPCIKTIERSHES